MEIFLSMAVTACGLWTCVRAAQGKLLLSSLVVWVLVAVCYSWMLALT